LKKAVSEQQDKKRHLPTGDEPPKGYETLAFDKVEDDKPRVSFVLYSQLARSERAEIDELRTRAFAAVQEYLGLSNEPLTIEREVRIIDEVDDSNKMFALVFLNKRLVGYSLVVIGWPESCKWLIQHMIIDPAMRGRGIGTAIVRSIEQYAQESEVATNAIFAIPVQESGRKFWQDNGYTVEAQRFMVKGASVDHELIMYCKAL
jgi:GNAT superfamily N-acetyltransferase